MPDARPARISRAEQHRWQRQAAAVLVRLLEMAAREDLPVISWTVSYAGAVLTGAVLRIDDRGGAGRRADWAAWRDALGMPDTERADEIPGGETRLVATWDRRGSARGQRPLLSDKDGFQMAGVVLTASIWPADDEEGS
jgi:hypothetical protein